MTDQNLDKKYIWHELEKYNYPTNPGLDYTNEFTCLVAVLLSARMRDDFLNTQTPPLFAIAPDAYKMHELDVPGIASYLRKIGLWKTKAERVFQLSGQIIELLKIKEAGKERQWYDELCEKANLSDDHMEDTRLYGDPISNYGIPSFRLGLIQLAGIGRKGANVFLNQQYDAPVFPVDTHVKRTTQRIGISDKCDANYIEEIMFEMVPNEYRKIASTWLVWHGRRVCKPIKPDCSKCLLKDYCNYFKNL